MPGPELPEAVPNWCAATASGIQQGDILIDFPLLSVKIVEDEPQLARASMTVVVLTQSCDIQKKSHEWVLLGQVFSYGVAATQMEHLKRTEYKRSLVEGNAVADFLLPPSPPGLPDWSIVHFRNVFSVPKAYVLSNSAANRLQLMSPYREHLSQAFARFLMRVGLPSGLQPYLSQIGA